MFVFIKISEGLRYEKTTPLFFLLLLSVRNNLCGNKASIEQLSLRASFWCCKTFHNFQFKELHNNYCNKWFVCCSIKFSKKFKNVCEIWWRTPFGDIICHYWKFLNHIQFFTVRIIVKIISLFWKLSGFIGSPFMKWNILGPSVIFKPLLFFNIILMSILTSIIIICLKKIKLLNFRDDY